MANADCNDTLYTCEYPDHNCVATRPLADAVDVYDNVGGQTFTTTPITVNLSTQRFNSGGFALSGNSVVFLADMSAAIHYRVSTDISANGIDENRLGFSVVRTSVGMYTVTLDSPHPCGCSTYGVTATVHNNDVNADDYMIDVTVISSTVFEVNVTEQDNGNVAGTPVDSDFSFTIPSNDNVSLGKVQGSDGTVLYDGTARQSPVSVSRGFLETSTDGVAWTEVPGSSVWMYNREALFGSGSAGAQVIVNTVANQRYRLRVEQTSGNVATLVTKAQGSSLSIVQLRV